MVNAILHPISNNVVKDVSVNLHYAKVRQYADDQLRYPKETTDFVNENGFKIIKIS